MKELNNIGILEKQLQNSIHLKENELEQIINSFTLKTFSKNETVLPQNCEVTKHLYFVNKGCLRLFSTDSTGNDSNIQFAIEGNWITDINGFWKDEKSLFAIQALEASQVLCITRFNLNKLFDEIPLLNRFFRILIQHAYFNLMERTKMNLESSAKERYAYFTSHYPMLVQRISQYHIASFIGVKPQSLSRIRLEK